MRKVLIAIPCMDQVPAQFANSIATLASYGIEGIEISLRFNLGSLIYNSRNDLAKTAISEGADFMMWFDSDMVFNPETLLHMLDVIDRENADFVTGVYYRRTAPFTPTIFKTLDIDAIGNAEWTEFDEVPDGLFEVAGCGFGCVLMRTDVAMSVFSRFERMFSPIGEVGEDLSFCWRARQCGYKLIADSTIPLGHVAHTMVTKSFYHNYKKTIEKRANNDS